MKWGGVFFCKKVENGGCFVKSGPFLNAWCIMYIISIFYFTFYLFGGAYASNALPAYGPDLATTRLTVEHNHLTTALSQTDILLAKATLEL